MHTYQRATDQASARRPLRVRPLGLALAVALLLPIAFWGVGGAAAGDAADPDTYRTLDVGSGVVTLDVQDEAFGRVVEQIIQPKTRVNILVAPDAAEQLVSLKVADLHWIQALDALTERIQGVMVRKARNLLRIERPKPVQMEFKDVDVRQALRDIADFAGASIALDPGVADTPVNAVFNDVPWRTALEAVARLADAALVEEDYGTLIVLPRGELEHDQDYYRFKFIRPPAPYKGVVSEQTGGDGNSGGGVVEGNPWIPTDSPKDSETNFPIIGALQKVVEPDGGSVQYIPSQNAILFTGTRPNIRKVRELAKQLDIEPPQVFIDMNFIVTSSSDAINLGLDAGDTTGIGFGMGGIGYPPPLALQHRRHQPRDRRRNFGTAFPSPDAESFGYGTLSTSQTQLLWNFLQRDSRTRVVQAPKLLALDNQEATIFIGESIRYARTTAATNQNGGLTFAIEEDGNSPVNVGFQLLVIPHVIPGEGKIRMMVVPLRRALTGTGPLPGFDRITVAGQTIDLPRVQSSELVSHMILRDGQTAVIGGLLEDRTVERADKVPFFGDLPLMGSLFQGKEKSKVKEHLLITITPRIVRGTDAANTTISNELSYRSQRVTAEYSNLYGGCLPGGGASSEGITYVAPPESVNAPGVVIEGPTPVAPGVVETLPPPTVEPIPVAPGR